MGVRSDQSWRVAYGRLGAGAVAAEKTSAACDINHRGVSYKSICVEKTDHVRWWVELGRRLGRW